jgi:hypothetical protein
MESNSGLSVFRLAEGYMLVTRAGSTRGDQVDTTVLKMQRIPLLGAVLNRKKSRMPAFIQRVLTR